MHLTRKASATKNTTWELANPCNASTAYCTVSCIGGCRGCWSAVCGFPRVVFLDGFVDFLRCGCSVSVVGFLGIIDLVGE
jgi:hypothetical protein